MFPDLAPFVIVALGEDPLDIAGKQISRAPYLARQMLRVEMRTPGETDIQLPDLFGSGVRRELLSSSMMKGNETKHTDTSFLPRFRPS